METKSFFGRYFKYKLSGLRGTAIAAAIMNFLSVTLIAIAVMVNCTLDQKSLESFDLGFGGWEYFFLMEAVLAVALTAFVIGTIMLAVTAVNNFSFYNRSTWTDVIGCLPLTYKQRFWGDLLSGLAAHMISFIPCSAAGVFLIAAAQSEVYKNPDLSQQLLYSEGLIIDKLIPTYLSLILMLLVGYLGVYASACLITSCCGKRGSAAFYTLAGLLLPAGIVIIYLTCIYWDTVGIDAALEISKAVPVFPGFGVWAGAALRMFSEYLSFDEALKGLWFLTDEPEYLIIAVLMIAALTAGAYFLGKYRKTERTGRDFVYGGMYHVISALLIAVVIGISLVFVISDDRAFEPIGMLFSAFFAFVPYIIIELVHRRSLKKIWLSAVRFAVISAACFGIIMLGRATGDFGAEKYIPSDTSVEEVRISGYKVISNYNYTNISRDDYVYASDEAISVLIGEHRRIIDNLDEGFYTGNALKITYVLKNGRRVCRFYSPRYYDDKMLPAADKVFENIRTLEPTDSSALGIVSTQRYDDIWISYSEYVRNDAGDRSEKVSYITRGREKAFMDILKHELINLPPVADYEDKAGLVRIEFTLGGRDYVDVYHIPVRYAETLAFLSEPENLRGEPKPVEAEKIVFTWNVRGDDVTDTVGLLEVEVRSDDESEEARELLSYIRMPGETFEEASENVYVYYDNTHSGGGMYIAKTDERAVLRAMLKIARAEFEKTR
ncbi:MAG: hypothetical protein K2N38_06900 [Oscillospiraceae bacterium]|nr:hypothetical protein [Oscillospiraceae bacterium]